MKKPLTTNQGNFTSLFFTLFINMINFLTEQVSIGNAFSLIDSVQCQIVRNEKTNETLLCNRHSAAYSFEYYLNYY